MSSGYFRRFFISAMMLLLLAAPSLAWRPEAVPAPDRYQDDMWVSDPDNYLTTPEVRSLNTYLDLHSDLKSSGNWISCGECLKPYQVAVVIIDRMDPGYSSSNFARQVMNSWGLGYAECNNGVLIFVSMEDRQISIVRGAGVSKEVLSREFRNSVIKNIGTKLKVGLTYQGLELGTRMITERLVNTASQFRPVILTDPPSIDDDYLWLTSFILMVFFLGAMFFVLAAICGATNSSYQSVHHYEHVHHHHHTGWSSWYPWNWTLFTYRRRTTRLETSVDGDSDRSTAPSRPTTPTSPCLETRDLHPSGGQSGDAVSGSFGDDVPSTPSLRHRNGSRNMRFLSSRKTSRSDPVSSIRLVPRVEASRRVVKEVVTVKPKPVPEPEKQAKAKTQTPIETPDDEVTVPEVRDLHPSGGRSGDAVTCSFGGPAPKMQPPVSNLRHRRSRDRSQALNEHEIEIDLGNETEVKITTRSRPRTRSQTKKQLAEEAERNRKNKKTTIKTSVKKNKNAKDPESSCSSDSDHDSGTDSETEATLMETEVDKGGHAAEAVSGSW